MEVEEDYKCAYLIFCSEKYTDILCILKEIE